MHELLATQPTTVAIDLFTLPLGTRLIMDGVEYDIWKAAVAALSGNGLDRFQTVKLGIFGVSGTNIENQRIDFADLTTGNFVVIDGKAFLKSAFNELLLSNDKLRVSTAKPPTIIEMYNMLNQPALVFEDRRYEAGESLGALMDYRHAEPDVIDPTDPRHPFDYDPSDWSANLDEVELYLIVRDGYVMVDGTLFPVTYLIESLREDRNNFDILHESEQPKLS